MTNPQASAAGEHSRLPGRVQQGIAQLIAVLILVQAILAGRYLFSAWTITLHGAVGNATFALALGLLIVTGFRRADRSALVVSVALVLVLTVQIGLGYAGRGTPGAAAWHIPNGVLSFGLAVYLATRERRVPATGKLS